MESGKFRRKIIKDVRGIAKSSQGFNCGPLPPQSNTSSLDSFFDCDETSLMRGGVNGPCVFCTGSRQRKRLRFLRTPAACPVTRYGTCRPASFVPEKLSSVWSSVNLTFDPSSTMAEVVSPVAGRRAARDQGCASLP